MNDDPFGQGLDGSFYIKGDLFAVRLEIGWSKLPCQNRDAEISFLAKVLMTMLSAQVQVGRAKTAYCNE